MVEIRLSCNKHLKYKAIKPSKCPSCQWIYNFRHNKEFKDYICGSLRIDKGGKIIDGTNGYSSHFNEVFFDCR